MHYSTCKKPLSWMNLETVSLLSFYRYGSLLLTFLFYIPGPPQAQWYLKAGVSACLLTEALIFTRVYRAKGGRFSHHILVAVETVGLASILIITGGLDSPFLWYAVNPILLAVTLQPFYFCWGAASVFLAMAFSLHHLRLSSLGPVAPIWPARSHLVLVFILITLAAQLFNHLINILSRQTALVEKQIEHIKSLYEAVETLSHRSSTEEIAVLFASYSRTLAGAVKAIAWLDPDPVHRESRQDNMLYAVRGPRHVFPEGTWSRHVRQLFEAGDTAWEKDVYTFPAGAENRGFLLSVRIRTQTRVYGLLATFHENGGNPGEPEKSLRFLADLCAMFLEKRAAETLAEELLLSDEKDRIAGEMHDKVTQNIFGLIYGLDYLIKEAGDLIQVRERAGLMQKTARQSLRDLRESIYNLSSARQSKMPFIGELKEYLFNLEQINDVNINFTCRGDCHHFGFRARNALLRIIREATANSIRHGSCRNIRVSLDAGSGGVGLSIVDDGSGFDPAALRGSGKAGLGLLNMQEQARLLGGKLQIYSAPGRGTMIRCEPFRGLTVLQGRSR